jgi:hypothetical protein
MRAEPTQQQIADEVARDARDNGATAKLNEVERIWNLWVNQELEAYEAITMIGALVAPKLGSN